jgi:hypothetical protein
MDIEGVSPQRKAQEPAVRAAVIEHELGRAVRCPVPEPLDPDASAKYCDHCGRPFPKRTAPCTRAQVEEHVNTDFSERGRPGQRSEIYRVIWLSDRRARLTIIDSVSVRGGYPEHAFLLQRTRRRWRIVDIKNSLFCPGVMCLP